MKNIITITVCLCCMHILSFAQPGALDTTFANKGKFFAPGNSNLNLSLGGASDVLVQPDGKIIMVGSGADYSNPDYTQDFAVTRLNADGSLDMSFNGTGSTLIDFSTNDFPSLDYGTHAALQP